MKMIADINFVKGEIAHIGTATIDLLPLYLHVTPVQVTLKAADVLADVDAVDFACRHYYNRQAVFVAFREYAHHLAVKLYGKKAQGATRTLKLAKAPGCR